MILETLPRERLIHLPTPLHEATHLSAVLGGPRILIKRDDMTGLLLGGNKSRKLEFLMADAKQKGADVIITSGPIQSNHAAQTAAAARKLGLEIRLVLSMGLHNEMQGNLLLGNLLDADMQTLDVDLVSPLVAQTMDELAATLHSQGRNPYVIPQGGAAPLGCVGHVNCIAEIMGQLKERGLTADYLMVTAGSGSTMAGLHLGAKYFQAPFQVIGVDIMGIFTKEETTGTIAGLANNTAQLLEMNLAINPDELVLYMEYAGERYGIITPQCIEAMKLVVQTEGIILDPVYTGKTMAALIDLIHKGKFTAKDTVIFQHTGGAPGVFAYAGELAKGQ